MQNSYPQQGSVGCLIDPELMSDKQNYIGGGVYFDHSGPSTGIAQPTATPDTSFYQWVPFFLILQVIIIVLDFYHTSLLSGLLVHHTHENMEIC